MMNDATLTLGVPVHVRYGNLRFLSAGRVERWLAPSLRGAVLEPLKQRHCRWDLSSLPMRDVAGGGDEKTKQVYCRGCQFNAACAYGRVFEPDQMMIDGRVSLGCRDGVRGISIATEVLPSDRASVGRGDHVATRKKTPPMRPSVAFCVEVSA